MAWARQTCERIVAGEFDTKPLALFDVAQRMEVLLCQWQWPDDEFPRSVLPFVQGWHVSGDDTDRAIHAAARALLDDPAPHGAPLTGSHGDFLADADEIADF